MKILTKRQQGSWVLRLVGPLARGQHLGLLYTRVSELVTRGQQRFVLDLSGVAYVDAAGLGELVRCDRIVRAAGGRLILARALGNVQHVLRLSRVSERVPLVSCVEDAVRALRRSHRRGVVQARREGIPLRSVPTPAATKGPAIIRRTNEGPWRFTPIHG